MQRYLITNKMKYPIKELTSMSRRKSARGLVLLRRNILASRRVAIISGKNLRLMSIALDSH